MSKDSYPFFQPISLRSKAISILITVAIGVLLMYIVTTNTKNYDNNTVEFGYPKN